MVPRDTVEQSRCRERTEEEKQAVDQATLMKMPLWVPDSSGQIQVTTLTALVRGGSSAVRAAPL